MIRALGYRVIEHLCVGAAGMFASGIWFGWGAALLCVLWAVMAYPGGRGRPGMGDSCELTAHDRLIVQPYVVWMRTRQGWRAVYRDEVSSEDDAALRRSAS